MATLCKTCSAPLRANNTVCEYCNVRNDIELRFTQQPVKFQKTQQRHCPKCADHQALTPTELLGDTHLIVDKCPKCFGMFLDHGELERAFDLTKDTLNFDNSQIDNLINDRAKLDSVVKYFKCPDCQNIMNRKNYGYKSGVVIDICRDHGIWLDNGELTHLLEWKTLGGIELDQAMQLQRIKNENKLKRERHKTYMSEQEMASSTYNDPAYWASAHFFTAIVKAIATLIRMIFSRR